MTSAMASPPEPAAAALPVVFCDGDRQIDVGAVAFHAAQTYKKFQISVAQRIGVAPHQISTSLVRRKKARASPDVRRKIPIDEGTDFAAMAKERDCFVLAVLRRPSRRDRRDRRGRRRGAGRADDEKIEIKIEPERTILRRPAPDLGLGLGLWDYEIQLRNLQQQRERYLMSTAYYPYAVDGVWGGLGAAAEAAAPPPVCDECEAAREERRSPAFHWCVYDAVTVGFRSPVGPIERPPKKRVEASA